MMYYIDLYGSEEGVMWYTDGEVNIPNIQFSIGNGSSVRDGTNPTGWFTCMLTMGNASNNVMVF